MGLGGDGQGRLPIMAAALHGDNRRAPTSGGAAR
jgi:hypothetical protein